MSGALAAALDGFRPERPDALDVLRTAGAHELAEHMTPAAAGRWLDDNAAALADCTDAELERLARGEDPAAVLGEERARAIEDALL
jgi:hypothetical protein